MEEMNRPRVLVADPISESGIERLRSGADVDVITGQQAEELAERIGAYDALVVRSETKVTAPTLERATRLKAIARAGVGVDNIDVPAATQRGIIVVNSPEGNTIAAAEHTIALLLALSRRIPDAVASLRAGEWKRSRFVGVEVLHKTLGVIGLGKIGREVAQRGIGLGMRVIGYDAFVPADLVRKLGVELVEMDDLLEQCDYLTVHTPLNRDTRGLIGDAQFARMKEGVRVINCARGGIIDEAALLRALESGRVSGAALDVFEQEPLPPGSPLVAHPHVIATPHLGASTEEAQVNVAMDVVDQILAILAGSPPRSAVNMPAFSPEAFARLEPYLALGQAIGRLQGQLADGAVSGVSVECAGELCSDVGPITRAVLCGLLQPMLAEPVNLVNSPLIAERRGIRVTESKVARDEEFLNYLRVRTDEDGGGHVIGGTVIGRRDVRIRELDQFHLDLKPEGTMLFVRHTDRPGIIGRVGTRLGEAGINIAGMHVAREGIGSRAVMMLSLDEPVPDEMLTALKADAGAEMIRLIEL